MTPRMRSGQQPSGKSDWETPDKLMVALCREFGHFELDPCCSHENCKGNRGFGPDRPTHSDGLSWPWNALSVYVNPPYGRGINKWTWKCYSEAEKGNAELVVALLPVATDTEWWQYDVGLGATEVRFLKGRVHFVAAAGPAPFASAIVVWRRGMLGWHRVSYWDWKAKA